VILYVSVHAEKKKKRKENLDERKTEVKGGNEGIRNCIEDNCVLI